MQKRTAVLTALLLVVALVGLCWDAPSARASEKRAIFKVGSTTYAQGGQTHQMDVAPYIKNQRVFVPVRYLAYACGVYPQNVAYDPQTGLITLRKGSRTIELKVGNPDMSVDGNVVHMDVAPELVMGRSFLPARWVAEAFGYKVLWEEATQEVLIVSPTYSIGEIAPLVQPAVVHIETSRGIGTGFFWSSDGQIITNSHVLAGSTSIKITTNDGKTYWGVIEKAFPQVDLAVVRVDGAGFPHVSSCADNVEIGEQVIVLGHPLGVKNTVSVGIVSNPNKDFAEVWPGKVGKVIQLTAPVYPGNSGSPVFNMQGELVGVISSGFSGTEIAVAVPSIMCRLLTSTAGRFDLKTDYEMYQDAFLGWNKKLGTISSVVSAMSAYAATGQNMLAALTAQDVTKTLAAVYTEAASYVPWFDEVRALHNAFLQQLLFLNKAILSWQQAVFTWNPVAAAQLKYNLSQLEFWSTTYNKLDLALQKKLYPSN